MDLICEGSTLRGTAEIPASKSHTIRAVAIASLADGESTIRAPLDSADGRSAVAAYRALGAEIETQPGVWEVKGTGGMPRAPQNVIDVGNSGTTIRIALGTCSLLRHGMAVLNGDEQVRRRPAGPLITSLNDLGTNVRSAPGNCCAPYVVEGRLRGGSTSIEATSSQFLTSLLLHVPLIYKSTDIRVSLLNERPYVEMTLDWLERQGITVHHDEDFSEFTIPGRQHYAPFGRRIPADFSSATFFLAAGALGENDVISRGLDMNDTQGDRAVVDYLRLMGAAVTEEDEGIRVRAKGLAGCEINLNNTPDALPMMAVLGCFAKGTTRLVNVPQARLKETDRIAVMKTELERMGARVEELPDGLVVQESKLHSAEVDGHGDHRVVMALAIAATMLPGRTVIHGSKAVEITFPKFVQELTKLGGKVHIQS